jgi:hypothetical protein
LREKRPQPLFQDQLHIVEAKRFVDDVGHLCELLAENNRPQVGIAKFQRAIE